MSDEIESTPGWYKFETTLDEAHRDFLQDRARETGLPVKGRGDWLSIGAEYPAVGERIAEDHCLDEGVLQDELQHVLDEIARDGRDSRKVDVRIPLGELVSFFVGDVRRELEPDWLREFAALEQGLERTECGRGILQVVGIGDFPGIATAPVHLDASDSFVRIGLISAVGYLVCRETGNAHDGREMKRYGVEDFEELPDPGIGHAPGIEADTLPEEFGPVRWPLDDLALIAVTLFHGHASDHRCSDREIGMVVGNEMARMLADSSTEDDGVSHRNAADNTVLGHSPFLSNGRVVKGQKTPSSESRLWPV